MSQAQPVNSPVSFHAQLQLADFAHWKDLHKRIDDFTTAKLIAEFLDQYPSLKVRHMGVYLRARETVQRYRIRCAKRYYAGLLVGNMVRGIGHIFKMIGRAIVRKSAMSASVDRSQVPSVHCAESSLVWPKLFDPSDLPQRSQ